MKFTQNIQICFSKKFEALAILGLSAPRATNKHWLPALGGAHVGQTIPVLTTGC